MSDSKKEKNESEESSQEVILSPEHPLYGVFGMWRKDPEKAARMMQGVEEYRRKLAREEARIARNTK
jgi:hypothetical protein